MLKFMDFGEKLSYLLVKIRRLSDTLGETLPSYYLPQIPVWINNPCIKVSTKSARPSFLKIIKYLIEEM